MNLFKQKIQVMVQKKFGKNSISLGLLDQQKNKSSKSAEYQMSEAKTIGRNQKKKNTQLNESGSDSLTSIPDQHFILTNEYTTQKT